MLVELSESDMDSILFGLESFAKYPNDGMPCGTEMMRIGGLYRRLASNLEGSDPNWFSELWKIRAENKESPK